MKRSILIVTTLYISIFSISAQVSYSVHAGAGPAKSLRSAAVRIPSWNGQGDYALRPIRQSETFKLGFGISRVYNSRFLVQSEVAYSTSSTEYAMWQIPFDSENRPSMTIQSREHRLTIPVSIGAQLGNFSLHSGVNLNAIIYKDSGFKELPDFVDNGSVIYLGWQAGLRYDLGPVGLEVRYEQDFRNYGQGLETPRREVLFYGNRSRFMILAHLRLNHSTKKR